MGLACRRAVAVVVAFLLLAACGGTAPRATGPTSTTVALSPSSAPDVATPAPTTTAPAPTTTAPARPLAPTSTTPIPATPATPATAAPAEAPADPLLASAGAGQIVTVTAARYGATTATLVAYEREGSGWRRALGPWTARIGRQGLAPPGEKREGDGRTPSGTYGFDFFFGVTADPGVKFPYRRVTGPSIVWDDDPASLGYNTWVDLDRQQAGAEPEPMFVSPAYDHGAVIAYNTARTPGLGSAIFLHVSTGAATAGCVSLPVSQLVEVLRWLDPSRSPRIALGVVG